MSPRVLLLAAGHGRRAGGPKIWREHEGRPMIEAQLEFLKTVTELSRVAVSIQEPWRERCESISPEVKWVGVDPDASPLASLQALIRAARVERSFVYHVDMPVFDAAVFAKLAESRLDAVPSFEGKRGHPVLLTTPTLLEILHLSPELDRLDEFLRRHGITEVPVKSALILKNQNGALA